MNRKKLRAVGLVLGLIVVALFFFGPKALIRVAYGDDGKPKVVPLHTKIFDLTYDEWAARWWQWLLPIPPNTPAPTLDTTGAECDLGQSGPVWFLAGTSSDTSGGHAFTRSCTIPTGKYIFFPIINIVDDWPCPPAFNFNPDPGRSLEDFLVADADKITKNVSVLEVDVDGSVVNHPFKYRATSPLVGFTADPGWVFNDPCVTGTPQVGVADGYWIMLRPLSVGPHTLHFRGVNGSFETEVTYHLTIAP